MNISQILSKITADKRLVFIVFVVATLLAYIPVMRGEFIFDDEFLIQRNGLILDVKNIPQFFVKSTTEGAYMDDSNFYRPLQGVVYTFVNSVFGLNPTVFHLVSIFIHFVNVCLIYTLFTKFKLKKEIVFLLTFLYAIHPVNTQAVSYISGIADPMALFFSLLCINYFIDRRKNIKPKDVLILALLNILALLSKENTVVLPMILFVLYEVEFLFEKQKSKTSKDYRIIIVSGVITAIYMFLKFTVFNFTGNAGLAFNDNVYTQNLIVRILSFIASIWEYFLLIVFPVDLYYEKPYNATTTLFDLRFIAGLIILCGFAYLFYKSYLNKRILSILGILMFFIFFIPLSGIIPLNSVFLEHWLYFPLIGLILLGADILSDLKIKDFTPVYVVILVIGLLLGVRTYVRNIQWSDGVKFFENEYNYAPNSGRIINNLAGQYANHGQKKKAIEMFELAAIAEKDRPQPLHNIGVTYMEIKEYKLAEEYFYKALEKDANFIYSLYSLTELYKQTGNTEMANKFAGLFNKVYAGEKIKFEDIKPKE